MSEKKKSAWVKPELIVLTRNHPEEAVLAWCKGGGWCCAEPGPDHGDCLHTFCEQCEYQGNS
jgi:hypothetical protein